MHRRIADDARSRRGGLIRDFPFGWPGLGSRTAYEAGIVTLRGARRFERWSDDTAQASAGGHLRLLVLNPGPAHTSCASRARRRRCGRSRCSQPWLHRPRGRRPCSISILRSGPRGLAAPATPCSGAAIRAPGRTRRCSATTVACATTTAAPGSFPTSHRTCGSRRSDSGRASAASACCSRASPMASARSISTTAGPRAPTPPATRSRTTRSSACKPGARA